MVRKGLVALIICASAGAVYAQRQASGVPAAPDDKTIVHVLNRLGFGPAPGDVARVREVGLAKYIDQQLNPDKLADEKMAPRLAGFETLTMTSRAMAEEIFIPADMARREAQRNGEERPRPQQPGAMQGERRVIAELNQQKLLRAIYSEKQLEEVMVDFWFNHFNVFAGKGQTKNYLTEYERDTIRPRVFGKFRDLLGAVAESPAMLFYLDNWQSAAPADAETMMPQAPRPGRGRLRRPMPEMTPPPQQQRRRGVNENYARELMELHTLGVDGGYTQKDVQEVARAFTGWTIQQPRQGGSFRFEPRMHDNGAKVVLGTKIEGAGKKDGERVLDLLAKHPSTARFIATKLARRFVADDPPKALVDRAAATFTATDGDIRAVVRTIVTSPEFFAPASQRAKVKTPFEFVASAVRALGAEASNVLPLVQALRGELGMPLYGAQPPTGYADRADAWVNTGALLNRMNFAVALASGRTRGVTPSGAIGTDAILTQVLAGDVSASTRSTVAKGRGPQAVALLLGSPEFQRR
jgi:uncharacterized protein (DUF1800 family)